MFAPAVREVTPVTNSNPRVCCLPQTYGPIRITTSHLASKFFEADSFLLAPQFFKLMPGLCGGSFFPWRLANPRIEKGGFCGKPYQNPPEFFFKVCNFVFFCWGEASLGGKNQNNYILPTCWLVEEVTRDSVVLAEKHLYTYNVHI